MIQQLTTYLQQKASSNPSLSSLASLLSQNPVPPVGLVLTERLINMPSEVVPPMYSMLQEEITWAIEHYPRVIDFLTANPRITGMATGNIEPKLN